MYIRLLLKCLQQIMRTLKSEDSESVRIFDLLLELYKIFKSHPPESLSVPIFIIFLFIFSLICPQLSNSI